MPHMRTVIVTGASGFLGRMVAAALLANEDVELVLPIRERQKTEDVAAALLVELQALGAAEQITHAHFTPLPSFDQFDRLFLRASGLQINEVVHCAGSLSYEDDASLKQGNIDFTSALLESAKRSECQRFVFLSTAFASGLVDGSVPEALHEGPRADPSAYMRSKREAEWLVARSGVPYLIVRPAIVIGDSRDGRYPGKPYGLYQIWTSAETFASLAYMPSIHAIAPRVPLQVVHQNAFQSAFLAAYRLQPNGSVVHIAGREDILPTVRNLWDLWLKEWARPEEVHYYDRIEDVPIADLDWAQRMFVQFAAANIEISTHAWRFQTRNLEALRLEGLEFPDATIGSVRTCQQSFMAQSPRIQRFLGEHTDKMGLQPRIFEHGLDRQHFR